MAASYPTAVKVFTSRNSGDVISQAHVNDLQDEANAIESGLLTGIAHAVSPDGDVTRALGTSAKRWLHPSGTAAAPGVAVGATGVGVYSSGANALEFGTAGIKAIGIDSTQFIDSPTQPRCVAYHNTTQVVVAGNADALALNSEEIDVSAMHDPVTNNSRVTIPTGGDGLYLVLGQSQANWGSGNTCQADVRIRKNGATNLATATVVNSGAAFALVTLHTSTLVALVATDYIELVGAPATSNCTYGSATVAYATRCSVVKLW